MRSGFILFPERGDSPRQSSSKLRRVFRDLVRGFAEHLAPPPAPDISRTSGPRTPPGPGSHQIGKQTGSFPIIFHSLRGRSGPNDFGYVFEAGAFLLQPQLVTVEEYSSSSSSTKTMIPSSVLEEEKIASVDRRISMPLSVARRTPSSLNYRRNVHISSSSMTRN